MAGLRAKVVSALFGIFLAANIACVTLNSAPRTDITPPESRTLIGFDAHESMILLAAAADRHTIYAFDLPIGPERALLAFDGPVSDALVRSLIKEHGWREAETWAPNADLTLSFHIDAALGDRRAMKLVAESGSASVVLERIPIRGATRVEKIARSPDARYAIVSLMSEAINSVVVIDLVEVEATLLDMRAIEAYAAGDRFRAAQLLERAVAVNPRAGDAIYNLACVHALLGDVERAADELLIALQLDPARYRRLANKDPDLAAVRNLARIKSALGVP